MARVGLSRDAVLTAAAELADRDGMDSLTLSKLAAHVGVRSPSLYKHVDGLDDVRAGVAGVAARALAERMSEATRGRGGDEAIRALARAVRAWALAHPRLYEATVLSHVHQPDDAREALSGSLEVLLRVFADRGLSAEQAVFAARTFRSLVHGFVHLEAGRGFGLEVDLDASFERMLDVLFAGLDAL